MGFAHALVVKTGTVKSKMCRSFVADLVKRETLMCTRGVELSAVPLTPKWRQFYFLPAVSPDRGPFI